ncbi:MAG: hypothetical protein F6K24_40645 [Okeania sp. SIO2D1]|uniref:hypothetical protein n=1 Tax=Okeania sp. SIO2C9 TaxID=2607791 RepID=UPI0013B67172|nr:hypothetical protein [Okeania sp. SIO2C9]NEQ71659.1 hypothetical protein [Okeania sp. SIO2C9]NES71075.1 hypothetical protein [Okeania sp. SIO2D1]
MSNSTFISLENPGKYSIRLIDRVKVKGKAEMVTVFEVFDADPPEYYDGKTITKHIYKEAIIFYYQIKFSQASQLFQDCLSQNPSDLYLPNN